MWIQIKGQRRRATGGKPQSPRLHGGCVGKRRHRRASRGAGRRDARRDRQMRRLPEKGGKVKIPGLENGMIPKAEKPEQTNSPKGNPAFNGEFPEYDKKAPGKDPAFRFRF